MINNYDYENGKIIALDHKEGIKEFDYQDNIDDIIAEENVIEVLENEIKDLNNRIEKTEREKDNENFFCGGMIVLSLFVGVYLGQGYLCVDTLINYIFAYGSYALGLALASVIGVFGYKNSKYFDKKITELKVECEDLKTELDKAKYKLNEYKNEKCRDLENIYKNNNYNKLSFINKMNKELKIIRNNLEEIKNSRELAKKTEASIEEGRVLKKVNKDKN